MKDGSISSDSESVEGFFEKKRQTLKAGLPYACALYYRDISTMVSVTPIILFHIRSCHLGIIHLHWLWKRGITFGVEGLKESDFSDPSIFKFCSICRIAHPYVKKFKPNPHDFSIYAPLSMWFWDMSGPFIQGYDGSVYNLTGMCANTRYVVTFTELEFRYRHMVLFND